MKAKRETARRIAGSETTPAVAAGVGVAGE